PHRGVLSGLRLLAGDENPQPRTAPVGKNLQHRPPSSGSRLLNPAAVPAAGLISKKGMKTVNNLLDEYSRLTFAARHCTLLLSCRKSQFAPALRSRMCRATSANSRILCGHSLQFRTLKSRRNS